MRAYVRAVCGVRCTAVSSISAGNLDTVLTMFTMAAGFCFAVIPIFSMGKPPFICIFMLILFFWGKFRFGFFLLQVTRGGAGVS